MNKINLKQIIGDATPDIEGSYEQRLAALNVRLIEKTAKLEKLREELKTGTPYVEYVTNRIQTTMWDIKVTKGNIIQTLIDFNGNLAVTFFELVED